MREPWTGWIGALRRPPYDGRFPGAALPMAYAFTLGVVAAFTPTLSARWLCARGVDLVFGLVALCATALSLLRGRVDRPRAVVVRGASLAMGASALVLGQVANLQGSVFDARVVPGDGWVIAVCAGVILAPSFHTLAWIALRGRHAIGCAAVRLAARIACAALAALLVAACARHHRATALDDWLPQLTETLRFAPPSVAPNEWTWTTFQTMDRSREAERRHRFERMITARTTLWVEPRSFGGCTYGLDAPPERTPQPEGQAWAHFVSDCSRPLVIAHDPVAGLLLSPPVSLRRAYDYRLHRWERGDLRRVRRPLAPARAWTACAALGLALALWSLARARRRVIVLDSREWREGLIDVDGVVTADGTRVRADFAPRGEAGAVLVALESPPRGMAYRDGDAIVARAAIPGTWEDVHDALADRHDADAARALAFACTSAAPLVGAWAAGLL
ncbi:MAG: hypothetical protein R3A52_02790 [Polyangiales bacterium]